LAPNLVISSWSVFICLQRTYLPLHHFFHMFLMLLI
jgi:hypothetical protein